MQLFGRDLPPLDAGLDQSICSQLRKDPIGSSKLNYNLTATLEQGESLTLSVAGAAHELRAGAPVAAAWTPAA